MVAVGAPVVVGVIATATPLTPCIFATKFCSAACDTEEPADNYGDNLLVRGVPHFGCNTDGTVTATVDTVNNADGSYTVTTTSAGRTETVTYYPDGRTSVVVSQAASAGGGGGTMTSGSVATGTAGGGGGMTGGGGGGGY